MILNLILLAAVTLIAWGIFQSRYPIRATLTSSGVKNSKNLPQAIEKRITKFCQDNLVEGQEIKLKGLTIGKGRIRWVFPKNADQDLAQRLRNFMMTEVYI